VSLADLQLPAPDETGATFADNAAQKASACATWSNLWTLGDDSGLCVDALSGAPGVFSARYAPTEEERRAKLLRNLASVPDSGRGAHFFCAVALSSPDGKRLFRADGRVDGGIAWAARGSNGFGYDPLFVPAETPGKTLAELSSAEKNRLSHRGRALERLRPLLEKLQREGGL
jgi:XTP/dITP diphosphohydrolase